MFNIVFARLTEPTINKPLVLQVDQINAVRIAKLTERPGSIDDDDVTIVKMVNGEKHLVTESPEMVLEKIRLAQQTQVKTALMSVIKGYGEVMPMLIGLISNVKEEAERQGLD